MNRAVRAVVVLAVVLAAGSLPAQSPPARPPVPVDDVEPIEDAEVVEVEPTSSQGVPGRSQGGIEDLVSRFHHALVHVPIGGLMIVLLLDAATFLLRRRELEPSGLWALGGTLVSFVPAMATGLLREDFISRAPVVHGLVETHETLVFVTAGVAAAAFLLRLWARKDLVKAKRGAYLALVVTAGVLVALAGHWGGKVAWGPDYLPF